MLPMMAVTRFLKVPAGAFALVALLLTAGAGVAAAQCLSPDEARQVVGSGSIVPLGRIVQQMRDRGADVTDARLCRQGSRYVYELTVVSRGGGVRRVTIDAHSGTGG